MIRTLFLLLLTTAANAQQKVVITPANTTRFDIPLQIYLPKPSDHSYGLYNSTTGKTYPLQWFADSAAFILADPLPAGSSLELTLKRFKHRGKTVQFDRSKTAVRVMKKNKPVFVYNIAEVMPPPDSPSYYKRSGFIHPLYTPSGKIITDAFPSNHAHQHALFHAWTHTSYKGKHVDFWNQHKKEGTVGNAKLISTKEGPVYAEMVTKQEYISSEMGMILSEYWTIRIYNTSTQHLFDITLRQENMGTDTLYLLKYIYGGMALRGSAKWDKFNKQAFQNNWSLLTSEGLKDSAANNSSAKWVTVTGRIDGTPSSATVIGHPSNFRYPQTIRVHPEMPYWVFSPVINEGFKMGPHQSYAARYRYVITDQPPTTDNIQAVSDAWK